jgi:hypothetical protein
VHPVTLGAREFRPASDKFLAGYPHKLWITRLLARHVTETVETAGHPCLRRLAQGTVCKILDRHEVQPHKVRYYLERRRGV